MKRLIIFDWDDVFTHGSIKGYYKCYHEALKGVGVTLPPEEEDRRIKSKWGSGHEVQLQLLLQEHPELVSKAVELYREHMFGDTFVDCLEITPGSEELLAKLAPQYTLTIATGAHPKIIRDRLLPKYGLERYFTQIMTIYDLDDAAHAKPHPYMAQKLMEAQGISPEETILVGDAKGDVLMAQAARVEPVVVLTGHLDKPQAEALGVRYIIDAVTSLPSVLEKFEV